MLALTSDIGPRWTIEPSDLPLHWILQAIRYRLTSMAVAARPSDWSAVRRHEPC
jgi:hypothetical protein